MSIGSGGGYSRGEVQALSGCCDVVRDDEWCRWLCLRQAGACGC